MLSSFLQTIVAYLARLHADLAGRIRTNQVGAARFAEDMRHIEAVVLKMFDPEYNFRAISTRRLFGFARLRLGVTRTVVLQGAR
jgi:hypothetical protein